jgi:hypothetical protein
MAHQLLHPLIKGSPIKANWRGIGVVAELNGINGQHPEVLPAAGYSVMGTYKLQQTPQVMGEWWAISIKAEQPGFEGFLDGLLKPEAPSTLSKNGRIRGCDGRLKVCGSNPQ